MVIDWVAAPCKHRAVDGTFGYAAATMRSLWIIGIVLVAYFGSTALFGYHVGRQIATAKANPLIGLGSAMIGRDATESFAIKQSHIPPLVTASPTFWMALRATESESDSDSQRH
jgi:hypothetical protein